jgi:hypothetical protein
MLLGLLGFASHSSLHSLKISSFSVYTLILKGSFLPLSVMAGTLTFRFMRYFSSSLNGWRGPLVRRSVMRQTGPVASLADRGLWTVPNEGPIAGSDVPESEVVEVVAGPAVAAIFGDDVPVEASLTRREESLAAEASIGDSIIVGTSVAMDEEPIATDENCDPAVAPVAGSRLCISTALPLTWPPCAV